MNKLRTAVKYNNQGYYLGEMGRSIDIWDKKAYQWTVGNAQELLESIDEKGQDADCR